MAERLHLTDDPARLAIWREAAGVEPAETVVLREAEGRRRLGTLERGADLVVLLTVLSPRAAAQVARPRVRRARSIDLVVLRGLAPRVALDPLLDALGPGLRPASVSPVTVDGLAGIAVTLRRRPDETVRLAALARLAALTASWEAAEAPVGPRAAVAGRAWDWVDGLAGAAPVDPAWAGDDAALRRAGPDVVVLGPGAAPDGPLAPAVAVARRAGAAVLDVGAEPGWAAEARSAALAPVDPAKVPSLAAGANGRAPEPVILWRPPGGTGDREAARALLSAAAAGRPVVAEALPPAVAELLGGGLTALLATEPGELADETLRERHGVRLRRAALAAHSLEARWSALAAELGVAAPPATTVSVLLATRRPDFLDHALEQVAGQTHRPLELVVAAHGVAVPQEWRERAAAGLDALEVVDVPADAPLGGALAAAAAAASGEVLSKMDDDDFYGPDHLADLLLARRSAAATLVGKGAEFYYFAGQDTTLRRVNDAREQAGTLIAGNTLTLAAADLRAVGGWQRVDGGEDRRLVGDVLRHGGLVHRTHGFGHVVGRHDRGHTWRTSLEELRGRAVWEAPGCRLDVADAALRS